jgi:hypothetical protein
MTDSRYVPRDLSDEPAGFGRAAILKWKSSDSIGGAARIRAANIQHFYTIRIRKRITDELMTAKQFAAKSGISYDRLMKVLRGEMIMRLEDIAAADLILGEVSELAIRDANRRRQIEREATRSDRAEAPSGGGFVGEPVAG